MGDLAVDVMGNMRLRDTVGGACADPAHDGPKAAKKVAVESCKSATGEGEFAGTVVREKGVGVLEECDQDEPVVDPKVGVKIEAEGVGEAEVINGKSDKTHPDEHTDVGHDDLQEVVGSEKVVSLGVEVIGALRITLLARCVDDQVQWPAKEKVGGKTKRSTERAVADTVRQVVRVAG